MSPQQLAVEVEQKRRDYLAAKNAHREALLTIKARKVCCSCKKRIQVPHKWRYVSFSGATGLEHWNCKEPESYRGLAALQPRKEQKA